jgi:hypothetical protein
VLSSSRWVIYRSKDWIMGSVQASTSLSVLAAVLRASELSTRIGGTAHLAVGPEVEFSGTQT